MGGGILGFLGLVIAFWMGRATRQQVRALKDELALIQQRLTTLEARPIAAVSKPEPATLPVPSPPSAPAVAPTVAGSVSPVEKAAEVRFAGRAASDPPAKAATSSIDWSRIERFVAEKWLALLGGLVLAIGGIYLAAYAMERGWAGPRVRIASGLIAGLAMAAAGEWLRRRPEMKGSPIERLPNPPAAATAAGIVTSFATVWLAHGLYGLIGPVETTMLLAALGFAAIFLGVLHGQALAGLGLAGANLAPLLVDTPEPNLIGILLYTGAVNGTVWLLANRRGWRLAAIAALALAGLWLLLAAVTSSTPADRSIVQLACGLWLALIVLGRSPLASPAPLDRADLHWLVTAGVMGALVLTAVTVLNGAYVLSLWAGLLVGTSAVLVLGLLRPAFSRLAAFGATLLIITFGLADLAEHLPAGAGAVAWHGGAAALLLGAGWAGVTRFDGKATWAAIATIAPLLLFALSYWLESSLVPYINWGIAGLLLACLFGFAGEWLMRRADLPADSLVTGLFLLAAFIGLALALAMSLRLHWLTLAFALQTAATVLVWQYHARVPVLLWAAVVGLGAVVLRMIDGLAGVSGPVGWVLGFALPAAISAVAAHRLARDPASKGADVPAEALWVASTTLALCAGVSLAAPYLAAHSNQASVIALASAAVLLAAFACGLQEAGRRLARHHLRWPALAVLALALAAVLGFSALLLGVDIQVPRLALGLSLLTLGLAVPGLLALLFSQREPLLKLAGPAVAFVLVWFWLTAEVRLAFAGTIDLFWRSTGASETYSYSAIWLAFGAALTLAGLFRFGRTVRLAGLGVLGIAVLKLFLIDMARLDGLWRAASFIGLGAALIGLAALFRRFAGRTTPVSESQAQQ
jgi:uncharacterized membrane protein